MDLIITILPVVTKDLPISPRFTPYNFFIAMQVQHSYNSSRSLAGFYLLTFPCFPLRKKEHKSYFGKNRTHDFRTSRCAAYLLDHSGDEPLHGIIHYFQLSLVRRLVFCSNSSRLIRSIILHSTQINTDTATDYISPRTSPAMGLSYRVPVSTTLQDFVSSERSSNVLYCCSPCCCCCCLHIKNRSDLYPVPFSFLLFKAKKRISVVTS